jgi:hypothetical protein
VSFTCGHTPGCGVVCSECQPVPLAPMPGNAPYLWRPMLCPDCLALAKILIRAFPPGNLIHDDLDAFIKEREK